jgi:hypothetical protein
MNANLYESEQYAWVKQIYTESHITLKDSVNRDVGTWRTTGYTVEESEFES